MAKNPLKRRMIRLAVALSAAVVALGAAGSAQAATTVSLRVELPGQALVPLADVTLLETPVAAPGSPAGQTCSGSSVIGALTAAVGADWNGTWTNERGWSIGTIRGQTILPGDGRVWDVYVNENYLNDIPCFNTLAAGDRVLIAPRCTTANFNCFSGGPLTIDAPATASPKGHPTIQVWQSTTSFDGLGHGTTTRTGSTFANVYTPVMSTMTDEFYGVANLSLTDAGPNQVTATKGEFIPGRVFICVTDGQDGYCGTTKQEHNEFNALDFCQTTGHDGECNTIDDTPPVGHIINPGNGKTFNTGKLGVKLLNGNVDRDPSEVTGVQLRLKRELKVTVKKLVRKKKVRDKKTGKRKIKKIYAKRTETRCYGWKTSISDWSRLKTCKLDAAWFKADGDEIWSFEFLYVIPKGSYTLDAQATDGKGNVDKTLEVGRNRVTFKVT
jgi:hypothetical protein